MGKEERRNSIPEWSYWRTEAEFFAERVNGGETERQSLQDSDYWKTEAQFWKANCSASKFHADRQELADRGYWIRENSFWRNRYKGIEGSSPSSIRHEINEAPIGDANTAILAVPFKYLQTPMNPYPETLQHRLSQTYLPLLHLSCLTIPRSPIPGVFDS